MLSLKPVCRTAEEAGTPRLHARRSSRPAQVRTPVDRATDFAVVVGEVRPVASCKDLIVTAERA